MITRTMSKMSIFPQVHCISGAIGVQDVEDGDLLNVEILNHIGWR